MEGAALKSEREYDMAIAQAWNGARFNALAQVGKLKGLSTYLGKKASGKRNAAADAAAFFHAMKSAGLPITITRVERKSKEPGHGR